MGAQEPPERDMASVRTHAGQARVIAASAHAAHSLDEEWA
jgi:hypothetical protein